MKPPPVFRPVAVGVAAAVVLIGAALVGSLERGHSDARPVPVSARLPVVAATGATATASPSPSQTTQPSASSSPQASETPTTAPSSSPAPKPTYVSLPPVVFSPGPPAVLDAEYAQALEPDTGTYTSGWRGAVGEHLYIALVGSPIGDDTKGLATVEDLSLQGRAEQHLSAGAVGTLSVVSVDNATGIIELRSASGRTLQLDVVHMRFLP